MKISKLHIDTFRHLENLDFDFTYPLDYKDKEKAGKPLSKICFIGQSATGKTSLLELLDIKTHNNSYIDYPEEFKHHSSLEKLKSSLCVFFNDNTEEFCIQNQEILINYFVDKKLKTNDLTKKVFFPSELNINKIINFLQPEELKNSNFKDKDFLLKNYNQFKLSENNYKEIYRFLLNDFINYREELLKKSSDFFSYSNINDIIDDLNKWRKENPNPNEEFAIKFNEVLKKLNLEVDVNNPSSFLNIKHYKSDVFIPILSLSTGTKLLISLLLPLYKFDTKDSIILIDEPERSLYPDMQMDLMDYYQNLASEAQFIVATHSPFIAASFEPEERFILYFDKEGKVAVRRGSSPIGDDPNDILYNDFGIDYINKYGKKAYNEYLKKRKQLLFEKDEKVKEKLQDEIEHIGDKYNF